MGGHGHSHDGIDWNERLRGLREADELAAAETARLVGELVEPGDRSVIEVGAGAGGTAAAFAGALASGSVTVVDSAPELLAAASEHASGAAAPGVEIRTVLADAADDGLVDAAAPADLVFASFVVHHLPDQQEGMRRLSGLVRPGGRLAVVESGLPTRVLPWDVGLAEPGLEERLYRCRSDWFREMRAEMPGSERMPVGWSTVMARAGLTGHRSWSYLIDRPAPVSGATMNAVLGHLDWLHRCAVERASGEDIAALEELLDPDGPHYAGARDDVYYLTSATVHLACRPE